MLIKKSILLIGKEKIKCVFKRSKKAKYMRLEVSPQGELTAVCPWRVSFSVMENFIRSKRDWVLDNAKRKKEKRYSIFHDYDRSKYLANKKKAEIFVREKIRSLNQFYKYEFNRLSIRNQKTRWGSCSSKKDLSFNYKIIFLPEKLADYIVAHELCHLSELNHSTAFWELVGKTIPDYNKIRKELKKI